MGNKISFVCRMKLFSKKFKNLFIESICFSFTRDIMNDEDVII